MESRKDNPVMTLIQEENALAVRSKLSTTNPKKYICFCSYYKASTSFATRAGGCKACEAETTFK